MLSLAAVLLTVSFVAFRSDGSDGPSVAGATLSALAACAATVLEHGVLNGMLVAIVLAMTAASVLVLVLPPRPHLSKPVAIGSGILGIGVGATALVGGVL